MNEEELLEIMRTRLRIKAETSSAYTGGLDGGPAYRDCCTIQLLLDGEVISEAPIDCA